MVHLYLEILSKLYFHEDNRNTFEAHKVSIYESNIEGCLEDIIEVFTSQYDEFSDFSSSSDDEDNFI